MRISTVSDQRLLVATAISRRECAAQVGVWSSVAEVAMVAKRAPLAKSYLSCLSFYKHPRITGC
jgi:hypothetical protein